MLMPFRKSPLARHDSGGGTNPSVENIQQMFLAALVDGRHREIVQYQQVDFRQLIQQLFRSAVDLSESVFLQEQVCPEVAHGLSRSHRREPQRTGISCLVMRRCPRLWRLRIFK